MELQILLASLNSSNTCMDTCLYWGSLVSSQKLDVYILVSLSKKGRFLERYEEYRESMGRLEKQGFYGL